jgi:hypothetical protein
MTWLYCTTATYCRYGGKKLLFLHPKGERRTNFSVALCIKQVSKYKTIVTETRKIGTFQVKQFMQSFLRVYYQPRQTLSVQSLIASAYIAQHICSHSRNFKHSLLGTGIVFVGYIHICYVYGQLWKMERQWLKLPARGQAAKAALPENRSSIPDVDGKKSLH